MLYHDGRHGAGSRSSEPRLTVEMIEVGLSMSFFILASFMAFVECCVPTSSIHVPSCATLGKFFCLDLPIETTKHLIIDQLEGGFWADLSSSIERYGT